MTRRPRDEHNEPCRARQLMRVGGNYLRPGTLRLKLFLLLLAGRAFAADLGCRGRQRSGSGRRPRHLVGDAIGLMPQRIVDRPNLELRQKVAQLELIAPGRSRRQCGRSCTQFLPLDRYFRRLDRSSPKLYSGVCVQACDQSAARLPAFRCAELAPLLGVQELIQRPPLPLITQEIEPGCGIQVERCNEPCRALQLFRVRVML
jgi:hypothetical protein